jgi:hypothetical protein
MANRIERGRVLITTVTRLEVGYSSRTAGQARAAFQASPLAAMPVEYLTPLIEDRAVEVNCCSRITVSTALRRCHTTTSAAAR